MSEEASGLDDKALARKRGVTALYLGLFAASPAFYIFQQWTFLPALILCGAAIWKAKKLSREGINAVLLKISAWIMVFFTVSICLMYSPLDSFIKEIMMYSPLWTVLGIIAQIALFVLLLFAILAIRNGIKANAPTGIILGSLHILAWLAMIPIAIGLSQSGL